MKTLKVNLTLLVKLGSLIIHYQEWVTSRHPFDETAIRKLEQDPEIQEWFKEMDKRAFLPVKR